jgi:hypothetical protein
MQHIVHHGWLLPDRITAFVTTQTENLPLPAATGCVNNWFHNTNNWCHNTKVLLHAQRCNCAAWQHAHI